MQSKDFIYYEDKNNKICSLGIEFDNIITNNNKGLFRKNLGVPMSLFLLNNEKNALMNIINNIHSTNLNTKKNGGKSIKNMKESRKNIMETSCIGNELFEKLIELKKNSPKKQKKSRKKKKKRNKRTRKLFFF